MSDIDATTLVTLLLDRSGSMSAVRDATIEAFNAYIEAMREEATEGPILFNFVQFDDGGLDRVCANRPIARVPALDRSGFQPRGGTPLIDASVITIRAVEAALARRSDRPRVVVCIQTDGQENQSVLHDWDELRALIADKTEAGWQFNFMGAGIDAYKQGRRMGLSTDKTMSYDMDAERTRTAFAETGRNTRRFASRERASMDYEPAQKRAAGDGFVTDSGATSTGTPPASSSARPARPKPSGAGPKLDLSGEDRQSSPALDLSAER